jgi:hypothetical protein
MVIVKIWAGLANQMFQYALYRSFKEKGKSAFVDTGTFTPKWDFEDISIADIFPMLKIENANPTLIKMFNIRREGIIGKAVYKIKRLTKLINYNARYIKEHNLSYNSFLFDLDGDYYLEGFWQSQSYFENITDKIRDEFQFVPFKDKKNKKLENYLQKNNSVSVHVRKGPDYIKKSIVKGTCEVDYYKNAMQYISNNVDSPKFIVFSDNVAWCKKYLDFCNPEYVDWNPSAGYGNHFDMQLMSICKHNIIANSSYSWWGAWLNNNSSKIVIGPKDWFSKQYCIDNGVLDTKDIIPKSWVKL